MVLERKILSSPRGFKGLSNPSRVHARLITRPFPILGLDKGVEPPALRVISYAKREARAPTDYATCKISVGMAPSIPSSGRPRTRSQPGHEADGGAPTPLTQ